MQESKVKRIYLVRHGETFGNIDLKHYNDVPDFAIKLTEKGKDHSRQVGRFLKLKLQNLKIESQKTRLFYSPYKRTVQTTFEILSTMGKDFAKKYINGIFQNDRLVEQNFGDYAGMPAEERMQNLTYKMHRDYGGEYWNLIPNGENRKDVCNRVYSSFGTFHRDAKHSGIENIIIVSHGLTVRAFIKEWCHFDWQWLEHSKNPSNCSVQLIERVSGKYIYKPNIFRVDGKNENEDQEIKKAYERYSNTFKEFMNDEKLMD